MLKLKNHVSSYTGLDKVISFARGANASEVTPYQAEPPLPSSPAPRVIVQPAVSPTVIRPPSPPAVTRIESPPVLHPFSGFAATSAAPQVIRVDSPPRFQPVIRTQSPPIPAFQPPSPQLIPTQPLIIQRPPFQAPAVPTIIPVPAPLTYQARLARNDSASSSSSDAASLGSSVVEVPPVVREAPQMAQRLSTPLSLMQPVPPTPQVFQSPALSPFDDIHMIGSFYPSSRPSLSSRQTIRVSASFVADNNIPDGHVLAAGTRFQKSWKVKNDGDVAWPNNTELVFVGGDRLGTSAQASYAVGSVVQVGEEVDVKVDFKAPDFPGKYTSYWRFKDGEGKIFGHRMWCE